LDHLAVALDWHSEKIVGWSVASDAGTIQWADALDMAGGQRFPDGSRDAKIQSKLISDDGGQPTSEAFMKE